MQIELIKASLIHLKELQILSRQTFFETFASGNTEENMRQYLDTEFSEEKMKREISDPGSEFYLAYLQNDPIGYLKVNTGKAQTEFKDGPGLEIERIYVLKEFHGKQTGQILFDKAIAIATQKGVDHIWLGVWEKNPRAVRFYEKNGFARFGSHKFRVGEDDQTDILMKRPLGL